MVTISASIVYRNRYLSYDERNDIMIQLIRPGTTSDSRKIIKQEYLLDEEEYEDISLYRFKHVIKNFCIEDPIINMIQPGDYFRFVKNIGGADERMLRIRDFRVSSSTFLQFSSADKFDPYIKKPNLVKHFNER